MEAILGVLDGALPRPNMMTHMPTSDPGLLDHCTKCPRRRTGESECLVFRQV